MLGCVLSMPFVTCFNPQLPQLGTGFILLEVNDDLMSHFQPVRLHEILLYLPFILKKHVTGLQAASMS